MLCVRLNHGESHVLFLISLRVKTFYAFLNHEPLSIKQFQPLSITIWLGHLFQWLKPHLAVGLTCLYAANKVFELTHRRFGAPNLSDDRLLRSRCSSVEVMAPSD